MAEIIGSGCVALEGGRSKCRGAVREMAEVTRLLGYNTIALSTDTGINFDDHRVSARVRIGFHSGIRRVVSYVT